MVGVGIGLDPRLLPTRRRRRRRRRRSVYRRLANGWPSSCIVGLCQPSHVLSPAFSCDVCRGAELPWSFVAAELGPSSPNIGTCRQSKTCCWVGAGAAGQRTERCTLPDAQRRQQKPCFWLLRGYFGNFCLMSLAMNNLPESPSPCNSGILGLILSGPWLP